MRIFVSLLKTGSVTFDLQSLLLYRNMTSNAVKVNFNSKHLKKGDPLPPYNGTLRVYNMRYCPYAQRTVLALLAKNINFEVVNINLMEKPEWLPQKSAFAKVPAIEIKEGLSIYESLVTVEYLDEVYPQRPLLPKDPVTKAFDKIIIEATSPIHTLFYKLVKTPEAVTEENVKNYHKALDFVQESLKTRGNKFLDGSEPGFADYMIWPWFERILACEKLYDQAKIDRQRFGLLIEYLKNVKNDPVVKKYLIPDDIIIKFLDGYRTGNVEYEFLLTE